MHLKQLDILGFKSFANKTTIQFSQGITAVVGPNGCGKTNVLDALRWVLGEQKVTLLRGTKMEEIIFNGTRDQKPLGMAEVTFTVVNDRGVLPTEYNEVQITRRLFRSGESEYLLNKVPCRLKDITELFYDTGMGAHSYSVIQQDMIDSVISDKAEERRFLFEEAAGITKYKQRKRAALRKLEATENDFLRLHDIYSEMQTRVRSLKRQQKKAQRYQKTADEIKSWELYLASNRIKSLESDRREMKAQLDKLSDQLTEKETVINRLGGQLEEDRKQQIDLEQELTSVGSKVYQASEEAHTVEKEISILQQKRTVAKSLIERNREEIKSLETRQELLGVQIAETEEALEAQQAEYKLQQAELARAEQEQGNADTALLAARTLREQENARLMALQGELSSGLTEGAGLRKQSEEIDRIISQLDQQIKLNTVKRAMLTEEVDKRRKILDDLTDQRCRNEESLSALTTEIEQLAEKDNDLAVQISELTVSLESCQARRSLLEDMVLHYEGYESGVVAAMEVRERFDGIAGTVAELFVPVAGMETAVEAALGEMAGFMICHDRKTAERIITYLKTEKKGRVGILVPQTGMLNPLVKRPEIDLPGFEGWLDGHIETDESLRPLMQAVLANVAVFTEGTDPDGILERLPYGFAAVSTGGACYRKNVIAGGSDDRLGLFRRKEKIVEQEKMIAELDRKLNSVKVEKDKLTALAATGRARSEKLSEEIDTLTDESTSGRQSLDEAGFQLRTVESDLARLEKERRANVEKQEALRSQQYSLDLDSNKLTSRKESLQSAITMANRKLTELESAASLALDRLSGLQVAIVEARSRVEQAETKITHLRELLQEIHNNVGKKQDEIVAAEAQISSSSDGIKDLEERLQSAFAKRAEISAQQTKLHESQGELLDLAGQREKELKAVRSEKEAAASKIHEIDIRLTTIESETSATAARMSEDYDVDIRTLEAPKPDENINDEQATQYLADRRERLKSFGAVNLLALDEYSEAVQRETFLKEQLGDLEKAKKDLESTISRINTTARHLFNDTFAKVRDNFKSLFVELFSGGEADITLQNPSDPLESAIEISARPAGKKSLSITMMSGGERALTAIALLFSLYLVKPSPFCILDEIDAPLDDANCHRFLKIIHSFANKVQFIIITHNKISMEAAHNLYGVTMEEPGISKLVAVRFEATGNGNKVGQLTESDQDTATTEFSENVKPADLTENLADVPQRVVERLNPEVSLPAETDEKA